VRRSTITPLGLVKGSGTQEVGHETLQIHDEGTGFG